MGAAITQEALALRVNQLFAPLGDLARELRYGGVGETFGEGGYLASEIGYSYIKGKSWTDGSVKCLKVNISKVLRVGNVTATVKHFAAYALLE